MLNPTPLSRAVVVSGLLVTLTLPACSIYKAATAPSPVGTDRLQAGMPRDQIISILGSPKSSEVENGERMEMFEYINGNHEASKARILLYAAGDFFTLFLSELIFWPLEVALLQGSDERAVITYGPDDKARIIKLTKKDGTTIATLQRPEPSGRAMFTSPRSQAYDPEAFEREFQSLVRQLFRNIPETNSRVAVLPVEQVSGAHGTPFGNYLTEKLMYGLYEAKVGKVVERTRLSRAIEELELSHSAKFNDDDAKRIGHLLGAETIIMSFYAELGSSTIEMNSKAVSVETGEILGVGSVKLPADAVRTLLY
jgi:hypothetical protein